ncbi:MAG: type III pantothenate kinase [Coraliomargaritaceae bacterium]
MKILCIDIGNTNLNYAVVEKMEVVNANSFPTKRLKEDLHYIKEFHTLIDAHEITAVSFCSVVPNLNTRLKSLLNLEIPIFQLTDKTLKGIDLHYPKPEEVGHDRIANALTAQAYFSLPAIIIDLGTAITLDVVSEKGYEGGIIAPGFELMTRYLNEQTALLPKLDNEALGSVKGSFGKSTIQAMQLGVSVGFSGMVDALLEHVLNTMKEKSGNEPVVLSTGGSIANLTQDWVEKTQFVDHLTLIGLAVAYERWSNNDSCN